MQAVDAMGVSELAKGRFDDVRAEAAAESWSERVGASHTASALAQTAKSKHCGSECRGLTMYDATMRVRAYRRLLPWHRCDTLSVCQDLKEI